MGEVSEGSCSGGVSWFYRKVLGREPEFEFCCDEHDVRYEENGWPHDKLVADYKFYKCIKGTGRPIRAVIFLIAVSTCTGWVKWFKCTYAKLRGNNG